MRQEWRRLGEAHRDPAVTFLMLFPLALLHFFGRQGGQLEAFGVVEQGLAELGSAGTWILGLILTAGFLWALGRIQQLALPWRGGAVLILVEATLWGLLLGPLLSWLTAWLPLTPSPLALTTGSLEHEALGKLAIAAGAGLYEELLFRAVGLGAVALLLESLFARLAERLTARRLALLIALLLSSLAFALAHALPGDATALEPQVLAFRTLAGIAFGLLFLTRGLAVAAYAHAIYDALYLFT